MNRKEKVNTSCKHTFEDWTKALRVFKAEFVTALFFLDIFWVNYELVL